MSFLDVCRNRIPLLGGIARGGQSSYSSPHAQPCDFLGVLVIWQAVRDSDVCFPEYVAVFGVLGVPWITRALEKHLQCCFSTQHVPNPNINV